MEQRKAGRGTVGRGSLLGLGLAGTLIASGICVAQTPAAAYSKEFDVAGMTVTLSNNPAVTARLTVRPREMATATRTEQAGEFLLDSLPVGKENEENLPPGPVDEGDQPYVVYVPQQCVGARRCPLIVSLPWGGGNAQTTLEWQRPFADHYGLIVLAADEGNWPWVKSADSPRLGKIDAAMKQVLRKFAIDPDKIAILGHCNSGAAAFAWGGDNLDVFSRVAVITGSSMAAGVDLPNKKTEFFFLEDPEETDRNFTAARELRQAGHPVKFVVGLKTHANQVEDYDILGKWLQESWAIPDPAARPAPKVVTDSLPLLTTEALTAMTAFWESFQREPDSILTTARRIHLREVALPVAQEQLSTVMVELPMLAAKYPSVAAALKKAGLTAQQHEVYRLALISALATKGLGDEARVDTTSVLGQNMAFLEAHPDELGALEATNMFTTP